MEDIIELAANGKIKRYFRARDKLSFEGAVTHITQHASGTEPLFLEETDYLYILHLIKEISKSFKFNVLSFCLMLNHIHLLIKLFESNLASAMGKLFQRYAKYFNKKYERKGHVFSGAYRSALCFDDTYLLAASAYTHLNPVKAGLVVNPEDYKWSSCSLFLNDIERDSFINYKFVLNLLDEDISKARLKYRQLLEEVKKVETKNALEQPAVLDDIAYILGKEDMLKKKNSLEALETDLTKIIEEFEVKNRLRKPHDIEARKFLIRQLKARGYKITEIAERLSLSRQVIHKALK
jgi:putative transposase